MGESHIRDRTERFVTAREVREGLVGRPPKCTTCNGTGKAPTEIECGVDNMSCPWCRTEWDDDVQIDSPEKASWESSNSALVPLTRRPTQPTGRRTRPPRPEMRMFHANNMNDDSLSLSSTSTDLSEYSDSSRSAGPVNLRRLIAVLDDINE